ncbi:hypothetical protein C0J52_08785 [Blattella germanica]|nr:hypothetical protein C0J52_08785 [Blattella germanica]
MYFLKKSWHDFKSDHSRIRQYSQVKSNPTMVGSGSECVNGVLKAIGKKEKGSIDHGIRRHLYIEDLWSMLYFKYKKDAYQKKKTPNVSYQEKSEQTYAYDIIVMYNTSVGHLPV